MSQVQAILGELFGGYALRTELPPEARSVIEQLRDRFLNSPNPRGEAVDLYGANSCDRLALSVLWVIDRAVVDDSRSEPTPEEVQFLHAALTETFTTLGMMTSGDAAGEEAGTEGSMWGAQEPESPVVTQSEYEPQSQSDDGMTGSFLEEPAPPQAGESESASPDFESQPAGGGSSDPGQIGVLLEQFLEAVQSGADERAGLLTSLQSSFAMLLSTDVSDSSLRRYAEAVGDFLTYIRVNELLDDVRVMNLVTNIQEPYAQWMAAPEDSREGILEQATEFLSDFRTMFE